MLLIYQFFVTKMNDVIILRLIVFKYIFKQPVRTSSQKSYIIIGFNI